MDKWDVREAVGVMGEVLGPRTGGDWGVAAGGVEWSCWETAAHVGHDLVAYAGQLAGGMGDAYLPFDLRVRAGASPGEVLGVVGACGGMLGAVLEGVGPAGRGWHWGVCDPAGFAAMGVGEVLLHTYDITRGLGVAGWLPPSGLCAGVLGRLFPDAPAGDPADVLLWCTGRGELDGRARRTSWTWKAALAEGS